MLLNRERKLYFCPDMSAEQPRWLPLSAGIKARKTEGKQEKLIFYELGREDSPKAKILSTIKVITFLMDLEEADEAIQSLLEMDRAEVGLLESIATENPDNKAICYRAFLEVKEDGCGEASSPQELEICFNCYHQERGLLSNTTNGIAFTAENQR